MWGQTKQLKLLQNTLTSLKTPESLSEQSQEFGISRTVRDGINLCRKLGERYLWVDTLCIIQDSSRDKMWQISRMGRIYSSAVLTIVAASGTDADAGLLVPVTDSVNNTPTGGEGEEGQYSGCKSIYVEVKEEFQQEMRGCKWDTRGWTFQEKVLSTRLLVFTGSKTFFQCRSTVWSSMSLPDQNIPPQIETTEIEIFSPDSELERYTRLVEEYSKRDLSFQSDALKAFSGIQGLFTTFSQKSNTFTYGLPVAAFDFAFCWAVCEHRPDRRRHDFPSWSWVGWQQEVTYKYAHEEGMGKGASHYTSDLIVLTYERANGPWGSFKSEVLLPRSWGNYTHSANILFEASTALLRVTLSPPLSSESRSSTSEIYDVSSKLGDSFVYGKINLDRNWRDQQGEELNFLVVHAAWGEEEKEPMVRLLMCYEKSGDKTFRVNMMNCRFSFLRWKVAVPETKFISLW